MKLTTVKFKRVGAWTAVLIGLPLGLIFSFFAILFSLLPPLDICIGFSSKLFWHPITWAIIIITYILLLWFAGKKITKHLENGCSTIKTSYHFTLFVNIGLFGLIGTIFHLGIFFSEDKAVGWVFYMVCQLLTVFTFIVATAFTTYTIGLLIVKTTKYRVSKLKSDSVLIR